MFLLTTGGVSKVNSFVQLLTLLIVFVLVLALTYWTSRFVGGYQKLTNKTTNFENIEAYRISNNKYIQIIRVGKKYLVISVCKDNITKLTELNEDEFEILEYKATGSFSDILEKMKSVRKPTKEGKDINDDEAK